MSKHAWKPLRRAPLRRLTDEHVAASACATGQDEATARGDRIA